MTHPHLGFRGLQTPCLPWSLAFSATISHSLTLIPNVAAHSGIALVTVSIPGWPPTIVQRVLGMPGQSLGTGWHSHTDQHAYCLLSWRPVARCAWLGCSSMYLISVFQQRDPGSPTDQPFYRAGMKVTCGHGGGKHFSTGFRHQAVWLFRRMLGKPTAQCL